MGRASATAFAEAGYQYLGRPYSEMDCQAFVERCMKDVGITLDLPGSNAWYRKMTWVGTPEECEKKFGLVPDGALLYILEQDGKEPEKYKHDGIGNASHIGICTGRRGHGAIHSSKSKGCVVESDFSGKTVKHGGWNRVGLWDAFTYGQKTDGILAGGEQPAEHSGGGQVEEWVKMEVYAENGLPVNLRKSPSKSAPQITKISVGTIVSAGPEENGWRQVRYGVDNGWMDSFYLREPDAGPDIVKVDRKELERIYDQIGDWLGLRG